MPLSPVVNDKELVGLGPVRLIYVPASGEQPDGMVCVPIDRWIEEPKRTLTGLDDITFWQREIDALGIHPDALTVVCDDGRMTEAARVWFILQYFGLPVAVLNGGRPSLTEIPPRVPRRADSVILKPGSGKVGLQDRKRLRTTLQDVQIFDARSSAEFQGTDLKGNARGGHLPGAAHLAHDALLDGSFLRPAAELAKLLDDAQINDSKPIVSHCNGGGRAALAALAAVVAGRETVHVYYLSFADWAADEACPIARGH